LKKNKIKRDFIHGESFSWGVMFRDNKTLAVTVRKTNGNISKKVLKIKSLLEKNRYFNIPIIGGTIRFFEGSTNQFRANKYGRESLENKEKSNEETVKRADSILPHLSVLISILTGALIYFILPTITTFLLKNRIENQITLNVIETITRVLIFIIITISLSKTIRMKKIAPYHGAEHKVLLSYFNGDYPTIKNVRRYSIYNPACGTSFFLLLFIITLPFYSFISYENIIFRIAIMLVTLPIFIGISFDLMIWLLKNKSKLAKIIGAPGIYLQRFNTKEPKDEHLEIAISSLESVLSNKDLKDGE
jgi:uncharacterized protein YqhQ